MSREVLLSTEDNKFDPFTQWDEWFAYDTDPRHPHNSCNILARVARTSSQLSEQQNAEEIERAIDEIVGNLFSVNEKGEIVHYTKVSKEVP